MYQPCYILFYKNYGRKRSGHAGILAIIAAGNGEPRDITTEVDAKFLDADFYSIRHLLTFLA